jgi:restriction endonuclease Mrr
MTLPAYRDVDLALLLELVRAAGKPVARGEMYQRVASHFPDLTDADLAKTRANGRTKIFQNVIHWGRNHLRVRGLLTIDQPGVWQQTMVPAQR